MSRRRNRSSSPFSLGGIGNILNSVDIGTLASLLSQFAPTNASTGSSPFGNLGNIGNIANIMSQFSSKQGFYNQNSNLNQRRSNSNSSNSSNSSRSNSSRSNNLGDFDIDTFNNILSQIGFGKGFNLNNNYEYTNSSVDDSQEQDFARSSVSGDYEAGEDVIDLLRMLKSFLTEDRAKVIDAMITLYEENSK